MWLNSESFRNSASGGVGSYSEPDGFFMGELHAETGGELVEEIHWCEHPLNWKLAWLPFPAN